MDLHFDFTQGSTRAIIKQQLAQQLGDDAMAAAHAQAAAAGVPDVHHHHPREVFDTINGLAIDEAVKQDMHAIYTILAQAEAAAHGCSVEETHFHEVGEGTRIRNALEICCAFRRAQPGRITATSLQVGSGTVKAAHGIMNIPTPATAAIIADIPVLTPTMEGELCTPTSAAIIKHFVQEFV